MIIGLTGPNAAGKGEVAAHLMSLGFAYHSLSDVLREEMEKRRLPSTRENLIALGNELRAAGGAGVLAEKIRERLDARDVVDSIRNPVEVEVLRGMRGFILIGVDAPIEIRFARAQKRARPGDGLTIEEFREKEARENSPDRARQQLAATFALADHTVGNGGSIEELRGNVDAVLRRLASGEQWPSKR